MTLRREEITSVSLQIFQVTPKKSTLKIMFSGYDKNSLKLSIDGTELSLSGHRACSKPDTTQLYRMIERPCGDFKRVLTLPSNIKSERAVSSFKDGVLQVIIQKRDKADKVCTNP